MKTLSEFTINVIRSTLETQIEELNKLKSKCEQSDMDVEFKQETKGLCILLIRNMNYALDELNNLSKE